jgi:hypothetical protein
LAEHGIHLARHPDHHRRPIVIWHFKSQREPRASRWRLEDRTWGQASGFLLGLQRRESSRGCSARSYRYPCSSGRRGRRRPVGGSRGAGKRVTWYVASRMRPTLTVGTAKKMALVTDFLTVLGSDVQQCRHWLQELATGSDLRRCCGSGLRGPWRASGRLTRHCRGQSPRCRIPAKADTTAVARAHPSTTEITVIHCAAPFGTQRL